ncbi:NADH-quinone oxidoreductase subunit N [Sorangium cellulosum]|uniref:NADH-quinone oxidoreductase subunit N n=1 Tax=Sorangium cellulosum TaxID=56 RepID=A0A4P2QAU9_SORCE|nr:NADH-quinone oxidoreductase subunit N [Sorangium cellulosum]AUX26213.1 NADH-quinone oxidoreductase subunit N [Sorangium cellulosum]
METRTLDNLQSLPYFAPELGLIAAALLLVVWDLVAPARLKLAGLMAISVAALLASGGLGAYFLATDAGPHDLFYGLLAFDRFSNLFRVLFAFATAALLPFLVPPREPGATPELRREQGEFFTLLLVLSLGMNLMAASRHLLLIYLSLELVSIVSFVLAGFKIDDARSSEAALKYVIFGGVASGIMLYGMSWIFGITGAMHLGECAARIAALTAQEGKVPEVVFVGTICVLAGFGYKISAAPFHMWTPDVYEGAPTPVTAFLSVGPKAAGFAVLVRFFSDALGAGGASPGVETPWPVVAGCLAMATMIIGNLSALGQENVKRMLAYSSIAHAGYMLLGFSVFSDAGVAAIAFYLVTYCFMNLGAFLVVMAVAEESGGDEALPAFRGLGHRAPLVAAAMAVFLISLTGLPPTAGFVGKFYLFSALITAGGAWSWVLAVVGVLNSVVSLFYYARVLRAMYLEKGDRAEPAPLRPLLGATACAFAVPTLLLGVAWGPVYDFVARSLTMVR